MQFGHTEAEFCEHSMAPQDWDTVMNEFDFEIGNGTGQGPGEMASFVEPYIPFDGRLGWSMFD